MWYEHCFTWMSVVLLFLGCRSLCIPLLSRGGHFLFGRIALAFLLCPWYFWEKRLMHNEWRFWVLLSVISCRHGGISSLVFGLCFFFTAAALYSARDAIPPLSYSPLYIVSELANGKEMYRLLHFKAGSCVRLFVCSSPVRCVDVSMCNRLFR